MQQNQPKEAGSREQDNPALSQVVERNIRAFIAPRTSAEAVLAEIPRLP